MSDFGMSRYENLLGSARGLVCSRVKLGFASTLILDLGDLSPHLEDGYQEAEVSVICECPWRIDSDEHVVAGSGDDNSLSMNGIEVCEGRKLIDVKVFRPSYTAIMSFEGGIEVWVFPDQVYDGNNSASTSNHPWYVAIRPDN